MRSSSTLALFLAVSAMLSAGLAYGQTAVPLPLDSSTSGSWVGVYGSDGFLIANDSSSALPTYATVIPNGATPWTWNGSSTDPRATFTNSSHSARIASTYYSGSTAGSSFSFDVNLTDANTHQVAIYCLDYDTSARTQTIAITDTTGKQLGTAQTLSKFNGGVYARWNISGHVIIKVTYTGGLNAVVSGLFFSNAVVLGPAPAISITSPTTSSGTLSGTVGLSATATSTPGVASVQFAVDGTNIGSPVLPPASGTTYSTTWATSTVANGSHSLTATATDVLGQTTTATLGVTVFNSGPPPTTATFVKSDTTTEGNWVGTYGGSGALIALDSQVTLPSFAVVSTTAPQYTWLNPSVAPTTLLAASTGAGRLATTYYSGAKGTTFSFDVNLTDNNTHQVALYSLDYEPAGRTQTIDILKTDNTTVLDERTMSGFANGQWLVWNITGHVIIRVTNTGPSSAVVSGLFFGGSPSQPPTASVTAPISGATVSGSTVSLSATATPVAPATIASIQFQVDGSNVGSPITTSPYNLVWDSTTVKNGSHTITAIATDSLNQHGTSAPVTITVGNALPPPPVVSVTAPAASASLSGTVSVTASVTSSATPVSVQFQLDGANLGSSVSTAPYTTSWNTTGSTNGSHVLTAIATDSDGQSTTSSSVSVTVANSGPPPPGASFVKKDTTTQGNWVGTYGQNGFLIANDSSSSLPSYATVVTTAPQWTWVASTTAPAALLAASTGPARIASTYYSPNGSTSFMFDVNLTDGNTHQVALYAYDLENEGRAETITIQSASGSTSGTTLDTRSISSFGSGVWLVWNLTGHVTITVTNTAGSSVNSVISGIFFGPPPTPAPTVSMTAPTSGTTVTGSTVAVTATATATAPATIASVQFQLDGANLGSAVTTSPYTITWDSTKAKNGSHTLTAIATDTFGQNATSSPVIVTLSNAGPPPPTISIATPTAGSTITGATSLTASVTSSAPPVSVQYQLDGANIGSPSTTSPYTVSWSPTSSSNGTHVLTAIATDNNGLSTTSSSVSVTVAVAGPAVTFVKSDSTTLGNWVGTYGSQGAIIANDSSVSAPTYATVNVTEPQAPYTWAASTTSSSALLIANTGLNRIASTYYSSTSFTIDVNLTDGLTHQVAIYALDFGSSGRTQTIQIVDPSNSNVLDTRTMSNFGNGQWLVWDISGHVTIKATNTGPLNSVISGVFFGPGPAPTTPPPTATVTAPASAASLLGSVTLTATASATAPATITSVQFQVDGTNVGTTLTASPYTTTWDTTTFKNGSHTITAIATDSTGQKGTSAGVTVTTSNPPPAPPTVSISTPTAGSTITGATSLTATVTSSAPPVSVQFQLDSVNIGSPVTASPYTVSWTPTTANNGTHSLTAIATDNTGQSTTSSSVSIGINVPIPSGPKATFVKLDSTTQGTWVGTYGSQGAIIANDSSVAAPSYATISVTEPQAPYTWAATTTSPTALQVSSTNTSSRIASTYYSQSSFTFDLNLTDGNTHQIAIYGLDLELQGRAQTVQILDAANTASVLDTEKMSNFGSGQWLVWEVSGHVIIKVTNTGPTNAVISGVFFGPPPTAPPTATVTAPASSAQLVGGATLTATASAAPTTSIVSVQFQVDGTNVGPALTSSPYTTTWDTTTFKNGSHAITAIATDSTGQHGTSAAVTVTTNNPLPAPPTVSITAPSANATLTGATSLTATVTSTAPPVSVQFQLDGVNIGNPVTASPYTVSWTPTSANNGTHALTAVATDNAGQSTTSSPVSVSITISGPSATFVKTDTAAQGSWVNLYGKDGGVIANDPLVTLPTYATVTTTAAAYTWAASTTDLRALQAATTGTNRIASTYYTNAGAQATMSFNVNLTGSSTHQLALYLLDDENFGRTETINILNPATNAVLDTRTASGFSSGVWYIWNVTGSVTIQVVNTNSNTNAVLSALLFSSSYQSGPPPQISITSPASNATLTGSVTLKATTVSTPGVATVQFLVDGNPIGLPVTSTTSTFSTTWVSNSVANGTHVLTALATDNIKQTTTSAGVTVTTSNTGPPPPTALFLKYDTTTIGNWKGVYGGDGYAIPNDSSVTPSYGTLTPPSTSAFTWFPTTTDPRGLLKGASLTDRIASIWYTTTTETFDVNLTDNPTTHQMALYFVDWDSNARAETVTITDASLGTVLDTRTVSSFQGGQYGVWQISGHVTITVTYTAGLNAGVSGVFFGTGGAPPTISLTAPTAGTVSGTVSLTANATSTIGIASVQFQVDGIAVGTPVTSSPYTTSWNTIINSTNGTHTITAIATDKIGQTTTSAPVTVSVANAGAPPVVSFTAPAASAIVTGTIPVTVNATGVLGIKTIQFQLDGTNLGAAVTGAGPTYTYSWISSTATNGKHTIGVIATDYLNQSTTSSVSVTVANGPAPTLTFNPTSPANGTTIQGSVTLSANASSTLGAVTVQFQIDGVNLGTALTGSSPFTATWDTTKGGNGKHTITATATDILNQVTTATVSVIVANPAPVITFTSPSAGLVAGSVSVSANVTSSVGLASVQFTLDGANLGAALTTAGPAFSTTWDTTTATIGTHTLSAVATDVLGQTTTATPVTVNVNNASASFLSFDTTTHGNWVNVYGQDGVVIPNDLNKLPSYVTMNLGSTASAFTYTNNTTDTRALLVSTSSTNRIASDYVNLTGSTFTVDLNFTDQLTHRLILYFLDFAATAPNETITITDANSNAVLSTKTIDNALFQAGEYGLWNVAGHIVITLASNTSNATQTPLLSGIFFQTAPVVSMTAPAAGQVSGTVTLTAAASSLAGIANVQFQVDGTNQGNPIAAPGPYTTSWSTAGVSTGTHVLTAVATDINGLTTTSAPVTVNVIATTGSQPGATFVTIDTTTSGSWKGVYGQDGEYIVEDTASSVPSGYIKVQNLAVTGGTPYSWLDTEPQDCQASRGLQTVSSTSGPCTGAIVNGYQTVASQQNPSAWYAATNMTARVTVTDGQPHQLAVYAVDFDGNSRTENIQILNASTNAVIDQRSIASFHNGVYVVWNITGDVIVNVVNTNTGSNGVMSGLFFRTFTGTTAPLVSITSPAQNATVSTSINLTATATSSVGLASVRYQLDGSDLLAPIAAPGPYTEPWVTTTTPNGAHTLTAIATDTIGQTTVSKPIAITVSNGTAPAAVATFVTTDTTTSGNWVGVYGSDGFMIPNDTANTPAYYAQTTLNNPLIYTYINPTSDTTAPLNSLTSATTDRIASAYYQAINPPNYAGVVSVDLNLIDNGQHQVALYFLDWPHGNTRDVQVQILDASSQKVLDTETVSNYGSGAYLVWKLIGHVTINITEIVPNPTTAPNSVALNGIFFDPAK